MIVNHMISTRVCHILVEATTVPPHSLLSCHHLCIKQLQCTPVFDTIWYDNTDAAILVSENRSQLGDNELI